VRARAGVKVEIRRIFISTSQPQPQPKYNKLSTLIRENI